MLKGIEGLRKLNMVSVIVYMFTYLLAFFNIEEQLVTDTNVDEIYNISSLDKYTVFMVLIGIIFTVEIVQYKLLRKHKKSNQGIYMCLNLCQIGLMCYLIYAINIFKGQLNGRYSSVSSIGLLCILFMIFMVVQIALGVCKLIYVIKWHKLWSIEAKMSDIELSMDKDSRRVIVRTIQFSMVLPILMYYTRNIAASMTSPQYLLPVAIIFPIVAFIVPMALYISNIVNDFIAEYRYTYAVASIVLYMLVLNNTYGHLMDKHFSYNAGDILWFNVIVEAISAIICAIAIILVIRMYRQPISDEMLSNTIKSLNDKKSRWPLIGLAAFILLCYPVMIYSGERDFSYTTAWYSVTYTNVPWYGGGEEDEISGDEGIEVRLLGMLVGREYLVEAHPDAHELIPQIFDITNTEYEVLEEDYRLSAYEYGGSYKVLLKVDETNIEAFMNELEEKYYAPEDVEGYKNPIMNTFGKELGENDKFYTRVTSVKRVIEGQMSIPKSCGFYIVCSHTDNGAYEIMLDYVE